MREEGMPVAEICKILEISKPTLYSSVRDLAGKYKAVL
jgi:DNA-binding CsgD family transcriptional regulator